MFQNRNIIGFFILFILLNSCINTDLVVVELANEIEEKKSDIEFIRSTIDRSLLENEVRISYINWARQPKIGIYLISKNDTMECISNKYNHSDLMKITQIMNDNNIINVDFTASYCKLRFKRNLLYIDAFFIKNRSSLCLENDLYWMNDSIALVPQ